MGALPNYTKLAFETIVGQRDPRTINILVTVLYENHQDGPNLKLLNVPYVLKVVNMSNVLKDTSMAYLFLLFFTH